MSILCALTFKQGLRKDIAQGFSREDLWRRHSTYHTFMRKIVDNFEFNKQYDPNIRQFPAYSQTLAVYLGCLAE
jgi:hypothetical protein